MDMMQKDARDLHVNVSCYICGHLKFLYLSFRFALWLYKLLT
jgi:hypothetical protein